MRRAERFLTAAALNWPDLASVRGLCGLMIFHCQYCFYSSLPNLLSAVDRVLADRGLPALPRANRAVKAVRATLKKLCGPRDARRSTIAPALPLDALRAMHPSERPSDADVVGWFAVLLLRELLLRPEELIRLRFVDVCVYPSVLFVTITATKTSTKPGPPQPVVARFDKLCVWLAFQAIPKPADLSIRVVGSVFSVQSLTTWARAALPPSYDDKFTLYALKRAGVTSLLLAGVDDRLVQAVGRWASPTSVDAYWGRDHAAAMLPSLTLAFREMGSEFQHSATMAFGEPLRRQLGWSTSITAPR